MTYNWDILNRKWLNVVIRFGPPAQYISIFQCCYIIYLLTSRNQSKEPPHRLNGAKTAFSHVVQTHDYLDNYLTDKHVNYLSRSLYIYLCLHLSGICNLYIVRHYVFNSIQLLIFYTVWIILHPIAEIIILHREFTSNHRFLIILYNFASCNLIGRFVILIPENSYIKINEITVIVTTQRNYRHQFS